MSCLAYPTSMQHLRLDSPSRKKLFSFMAERAVMQLWVSSQVNSDSNQIFPVLPSPLVMITWEQALGRTCASKEMETCKYEVQLLLTLRSILQIFDSKKTSRLYHMASLVFFC